MYMVISSLPYGHQDLNAITEFKDSLNLTPQDLIKYHENSLLRFEQGIIQGNERMRIINAILTQQSVFYKKGTIKWSQFQIKNTTRLSTEGFMEENLIVLLWQVLGLQNMMENYRGMFWCLVVQVVGKRLLHKKWPATLFGELRGVHWISKIQLSEQRETKIDSCFTPKVEFYSPQDEEDLEKAFDDFENIYRERVEKITFDNESNYVSNGMGEYVERDSLVILDDVSGLADRSKSFVTFMMTCKKFGYSLIYLFHETAVSSPRWKDILSQMQIFCIFPSAIDLVFNHLVKFADRLRDRYVSRQQMWLINLVRSLAKTGYTSFYLDKKLLVSGAARCKSHVENPDEQFCYLNLNTSDKHFNTFRSRQTSNR